MLGISVEALKNRLHRARAEVRANLGPFAPAPEVLVTRDSPCAEIGTTFSKYLEGEIGPEACAAMQRHVEVHVVQRGVQGPPAIGCAPAAGTAPLSDELQGRVRRAIENALRVAGPTHQRRTKS